MKINKFIPTLFIGTLATSIAPLALTSCGKEIALRNIPLNMDTPEFTAFSGELTSKDKVIEEYKKFAETRPNDFYEDMAWGTYQNWMSFFNWSNVDKQVALYDPGEGGEWEWHPFKYYSELKSLEFGMTSPTFGTIKIRPPAHPETEAETFATASFKMRTRLSATVTTKIWDDAAKETKHEIFFDCTTDIKNILMHAYYAQRNDKTLVGVSHEYHPDAYLSSWIITPHTDSRTQYQYQYDLQDWSIGYNARMTDKITRVYDDHTDEYTDGGTFTGVVNTPSLMDTICSYKSYDWTAIVDHYTRWDENHYLVQNFDPSTGWNAWFNQSPEAYIANAIIPDIFTHYFPRGFKPTEDDENGYMETSESPSAPFQYQTDFDYANLSGWTYQLRAPEGQVQRITMDHYDYKLGYMSDDANGFVPIPDEDEDKTIELSELGDATEIKHYHPADASNLITIEIPVTGKGLKTYNVSSKINLPLPIKVNNASNYILDKDVKTGDESYIMSDLLFELPTTFEGEDKENYPSAVQFDIAYNDGSSDLKHILTNVIISKTNNVFTIQKNAKK